LEQQAQADPKNKKEVKTGSFSPPGVGGVLHGNILGGSAVLPCQAGLRPHSRTAFGNSLGDSPPKELAFMRFVAPQDACVNGKKVPDQIDKCAPSLLQAGIVNG
jgi:hypothetical protein